jgi:outer membrane cobalamin receptor
MRPTHILGAAILLVASIPALATIFGSIHGIVHDPQHRPVHGATVDIHSTTSDWRQQTTTDDSGAFSVNALPLGSYSVTVSAIGFAPATEPATVASNTTRELHFPLTVASANERVEVTATAETIDPRSSTTESLISRAEIVATPGADNTNSLALITDFVPGAYMVHDQLHVRGGHQVEWLVDGVPVPNTNIASNVGPQFDPKDVDYLEVQRGGYSAEYGDRAYGVFNVVPRSGFERNRQGELVASYGSFNSTNDQINLGDHSERFAWYGSLSGNRTDLGLETPVATVMHDLSAGLSGFGNLTYNIRPTDQLRFVVSGRGDHYQVPNDFDTAAAGIRDTNDERDTFVNFTWVHTAPSGLLFTLSPFYHFNSANYQGGPRDTPVIPQSDRQSQYYGGQAALAYIKGAHNARVGFMGYGQSDSNLFGLTTTDGSVPALQQTDRESGNFEALFAEEQFHATSWLTLNGGLRLAHFGGQISENSADARAGAAIRVPKVNWVLRGFYGRYYQPPSLSTVNGPVLELAASQGFGFLPLRGERDEQWEVGLAVPVRGWSFDGDYFHTLARNFFDHDVLGNSNIFFPLTIDRARIRGWEATVRSPEIAKRLRVHLAYSHQFVEGRGAVSGGLTDFTPPDSGDYFFLDHDQRDTLSIGSQLRLPWRAWVATNVMYGSGFLLGDGPDHFAPNATFDLAMGKAFGESWSLKLSGTNLFNNHYQIDESNTFGGTHFANPRQLEIQVRYHFHF